MRKALRAVTTGATGLSAPHATVMLARNRLDFAYTPLNAGYRAPEIKTCVLRKPTRFRKSMR